LSNGIAAFGLVTVGSLGRSADLVVEMNGSLHPPVVFVETAVLEITVDDSGMLG
jgi:hypothetical protein